MSDKTPAQTSKQLQASSPAVAKPECFVVMPISDSDGYEAGHFARVYEDIFCPACNMAGYIPIRADQVRETNMIHLDVLQRLLDSPMVLCDLSSRNPNVLFELGLRQAFDKPVVLVQEVGTPRIFDIAPLRYAEYRRARIYNQVLEDQQTIAEAIKATRDAYGKGGGINSIVRILTLTRPAALSEVQEASNDPALQIIRAELSELRNEIRRYMMPQRSVQEDDLWIVERNRFFSRMKDFDRKLGTIEASGEVDSKLRRELDNFISLVLSSINSFKPAKTASDADEVLRRLADLQERYDVIYARLSRKDVAGA
jgi:hypothetical protein